MNQLISNLPEQLTSFVGRERERAQVGAALASERLLTLTGAGGAGKTRLALEVAARTGDVFPDGVWWVELAPLNDPELLPGALAAVLGVRPLPGRTPGQAIVDRLAEDRALVILDNCEHVLEAASGLAEALLRGCRHVAVLATTRELLGVPGEANWPVGPMSFPRIEAPDRITAADVVDSDAGRLFLERAQKVRAEFALTDANAPAVAQICHELDGIPLAIELAAARVRMLSVEQIADELRDRFRLLTGGPRGGSARHRTLRASVDWSYALLSEDERTLFRRLAVFTGGWTLDAVEAVCSGDGLDSDVVLYLLTSLVDRSLVVVDGHDDIARYRLLETLREYALELLVKSDELASCRDRHLAYFLTLAERAATALDLPRDLEWLRRLEPEAANFDAAIVRGLERDPDVALRIGVALTSWWELGGRFAVGLNALARTLDAADPVPSAMRARALWSCAHLARFRGDRASVGHYLPLALALAEEVGDTATIARALSTHAHLTMTSAPLACRDALERAIPLARESGDDWSLVMGLSNLGRSFFITDEFDLADQYLNQVLETAERTGLDAIAWGASGLTIGALVRADHARCAAESERALAAARQLREPTTQGWCDAMRSWDATLRGDTERALQISTENEARATAAGAGFTFPLVRTELARAHAAGGEFQRARELLEVVIASGADAGWLLGRALLLLAEVLFAAGDLDDASVRAREAAAIGERVGTRSFVAGGSEVLARVAIAQDDWTEADARAHEALTVRVEIGVAAPLPQSLDRLAQIAAGLESYAEAARLLGAVERARSELGLKRWAPDDDAFGQLETALAGELGSDRYAAERAAGAEMTLDQAIGWARRARGTRRRPSGGWESLTPTELQVVEFVSQGMTNPQVAERMFISRATVKVHLSHIFAKLEVRSRSELTAAAVRRAH